MSMLLQYEVSGGDGAADRCVAIPLHLRLEHHNWITADFTVDQSVGSLSAHLQKGFQVTDQCLHFFVWGRNGDSLNLLYWERTQT